MKIERIAIAAITVVLASFLASCAKQEPKEEAAPETPVSFTVQLNKADAEYAEVVVRHTGTDQSPWFGFVTSDTESPVEDLIKAQVANVNAKSLHFGKSQTVALRELSEYNTYRYIAFGVNEEGERYGDAGSLAFSTSPEFSVVFSAETTEVGSHEASFTVGHDGIDVLTYMAFVTDDTESTVDELAADHFATMVSENGKLNEGVELLSGTSESITITELIHETDYRLVVYGIYDNNGTIIYYGTPAEVSFTTPIDLSIVPFSATVSKITTESATANVTYDAKDEELSWYGFVTTDLTSPAASLISSAIAGVSEEAIQTGKAKAIELTGLEVETEYRYIVTGIKDGAAFGVPADVKFETLSEAYVNCVFTVEATEVKAKSVTLTITHTGEEEFEYYGFLTDDLTSDVDDIELPANADANLISGNNKTVTLEDLTPVTKYRYVVVGRVNGNEYGTRGDLVFETADNAVAASYEDFLGIWVVQVGTKYEFEIAKNVDGESYIIYGLGGSDVCKYGINTPIKAAADFVDGKLILKSQAISDVYVDPEDNKSYSDKLCGLYVASDGKQYYDNTIGLVLASFVLLEDGTVELRPGQTANAEAYFSFRHFQVPEGGGQAYYQDATATALPNTLERGQEASEAYLKWIGQWDVNGTTYTISKSETNKSYTMGSFYASFTVNAIVQFDEATGDILYVYGETGQSVTSSGNSFNLTMAGSYNDGYIANGGDEGLICRFTLNAAGNSANIAPVTYNSGSSTITPEYFGIYGYNESEGWANFGMQIAIPLTITRVTTSAVPQSHQPGIATLKRAKISAITPIAK